MAEPILTLDEIEPGRPTIAIRHNAPDGPWQSFKYNHLDFLLRWFPVRFRRRDELYPLRLPAEFGVKQLAHMNALQAEARELEASGGVGAVGRITRILREMVVLVLDAPADVIDRLTPQQHAKIVTAFPSAVMGKTPTPTASGNPSTSDASSPASAGSTRPIPGSTG